MQVTEAPELDASGQPYQPPKNRSAEMAALIPHATALVQKAKAGSSRWTVFRFDTKEELDKVMRNLTRLVREDHGLSLEAPRQDLTVHVRVKPPVADAENAPAETEAATDVADTTTDPPKAKPAK